MNNPIFDNISGTGNYTYSTDMLSVFRVEGEKKKAIEPGMSVEEIADIISDRLIEIVKKDLQIESEKETASNPEK